MTLEGEYDGDWYVIERFATDYGECGWYVQRDGGGRYPVRVNPPSCDCEDFYFRKMDTPSNCRHIEAVRKILKGCGDGHHE